MASWPLTGLPRPTGPLLLAGAVCISATLLQLLKTRTPSKDPWLPSPRETLLASLPKDQLSSLPYPPDALPGGRDVPTPYGTIRVFEWGPPSGDKVLLLHGISTPGPALGSLAHALVDAGHRVMLFDFFGRGYSDAPADLPYDARLYCTQVLLALASSPLAWTGDAAFHLIGYSLGGGVAVVFAGWFPAMTRSVTVVASGGMIRREHVGWRSRLLYSKGPWMPEGVREWLVGRKLQPEEEVVATEGEAVLQRVVSHDASGGGVFDGAVLDHRRPEVTVAVVTAWQLKFHVGLLRAFVSTMRYAPIYEQRECWGRLGEMLAARRKTKAEGRPIPGLEGGKVLAVLGASDSVIVREEFVRDTREVLGVDGIEVVVLDAGHEVAITRGPEVAAIATDFWSRSASGQA
ncbi:Serine hydrolase-like protein [Pleurostoma richardsiae]|uniref:Serine hydrolase-like protein n=1 Tax=Pleurostoma richardsiae TaxID=41990 RepID=A0AA38RRP4_9PEZI|nr:Serine hydrolase-like protein [Pleurostoma richardsiae]